jgi:hypothetical protein
MPDERNQTLQSLHRHLLEKPINGTARCHHLFGVRRREPKS